MIEVNGTSYELVLTTRATREIAQRFGGIENLGESLANSEDLAKSLGEVMWILALLVNQAIAIHNLTHPEDPRELLTPETLELLTSPSDIAGFKDAIMAAINKGLERNIQSQDPVGKPPAGKSK